MEEAEALSLSDRHGAGVFGATFCLSLRVGGDSAGVSSGVAGSDGGRHRAAPGPGSLGR